MRGARFAFDSGKSGPRLIRADTPIKMKFRRLRKSAFAADMDNAGAVV